MGNGLHQFVRVLDCRASSQQKLVHNVPLIQLYWYSEEVAIMILMVFVHFVMSIMENSLYQLVRVLACRASSEQKLAYNYPLSNCIGILKKCLSCFQWCLDTGHQRLLYSLPYQWITPLHIMFSRQYPFLSSSSALSLAHAASEQLVELSSHAVSLAWLWRSPPALHQLSKGLLSRYSYDSARLLNLTPPPPAAQTPSTNSARIF